MEVTPQTKRRPEDEVAILGYLLGAMSEAESDRFEQRYLQDEALFEELQQIEDELIDDYASGALTGEDRTRFEQHFLQSPERREKLQLALAMTKQATVWQEQRDAESTLLGTTQVLPAELTKTNQSSAKVFPIRLWSRPVPAWREWAAIAAALLIAIGSGALWLRNRELHRELAAVSVDQSHLREQAAAEATRAVQAETQLDVERKTSNDQIRKLTERVETLAKQGQTVGRTIFEAFVRAEYLSRSTRGSGESKVMPLEIPVNTRTVRLGVEFEISRFQTFSATLRGADGRPAWSTRRNLKGLTHGDRQSVSLIIPAEILRAGRYDLVVNGVKPDGDTEGVGTYFLEVVRR